jgi:hypothetical protein
MVAIFFDLHLSPLTIPVRVLSIEDREANAVEAGNAFLSADPNVAIPGLHYGSNDNIWKI